MPHAFADPIIVCSADAAESMLAKPLAAVRVARPHLGFVPRAIVEAIFLTEGPIGPANAIARQLGLHSRFQLARLLKREGLPPLHVMAGWATVLSWVVAAERDGVSLCWLAFRSKRHPSACYRLVREVTGLSWQTVRARGSRWVELQFLKEVKQTLV